MKASLRMLGFAVAGVFLLGSSGARADIKVVGTVVKDKELTIDETITINKTIDLTVAETIEVDAAAEQLIFKNQRLSRNIVEDENGVSLALVLNDAFGSLQGLLQFNNNSGLENLQANELSIAYVAEDGVTTDGSDGGFAHAQVDIGQVLGTGIEDEITVGGETLPADNGNTYTQLDPLFSVAILANLTEATPPAISAPIDEEDEASVLNALASALFTASSGNGGPGSGGIGLAQVNNNSGHLNIQDNALAAGVAENAVYALGDLELGQTGQDNVVDVKDQIRLAIIANGTFNGWQGVVQLNNNAGHKSAQANVVDLAVANDVGLAVDVSLGTSP